MDEEKTENSKIYLGEDLYGLSINEIQERIGLFQSEITRLERELTIKSGELLAADKLFGKNS